MNRQDLDIIRGHIDVQLGQIQALHHKLEVEKRECADGYPRQSMGDGGSRASERDENNVPLPARPADPTAQAVIARNEGHAGQISAAQRQIEAAALSARKVLESAIGRAVNVLEPPKEPPAAVEPDCASCGNAAPATERQVEQRRKRWGRDRLYADLCDQCASFVVSHGRRPPKLILDKWRDGKKVYDKDVIEALGKAG